MPSPGGPVLYVANYQSGTVSVVDPATNTVTGTIPVPVASEIPVATPDGSKVYVTTFGSVSVIDAVTNAVSSIGGFDWARSLAVSPDSSRAYVADKNNSALDVIDTATETVVASVGVFMPWGVAVSPDGLHVYVSLDEQDTVVVISTVTNNRLSTSYQYANSIMQPRMVGVGAQVKW